MHFTNYIIQIDWNAKEDDEICAELRTLGRELKDQMKSNEYHKKRLLEVVDCQLQFEQYRQVLDTLDGQVEQGYLKRFVSFIKPYLNRKLIRFYSVLKNQRNGSQRAQRQFYQKMQYLLWKNVKLGLKLLAVFSTIKTCPCLPRPFMNNRPLKIIIHLHLENPCKSLIFKFVHL